MSTDLHRAVILTLAALLAPACVPAGGEGENAAPRTLRVCADPNNLPFSNSRLEGFENRIAELVAGELGAELEYTWWAQHRGFLRNTLNAEVCDVVIGVPAGFERALTTRPYYRSTYAFVHRADRGYDIRSFDDPRLRDLRIGVHLVGDDYANTPPLHALAHRNIVSNVVGFSIYGDYSQENPPARLIDAVAAGEVDVAVAWGPLAGYFAERAEPPLTVRPVASSDGDPALVQVFDIAMGVRRNDPSLKASLEAVLDRRAGEIRRILEGFGVPMLAPAPFPREGHPPEAGS